MTPEFKKDAFSYNQAIDKALLDHLGIDENHPEFKEIKKKLIENLAPLIARSPIIANKELFSLALSIYMDKNKAELMPQKKTALNRMPDPTRDLMALKRDCQKLINEKYPDLANALTKKLNTKQSDPNKQLEMLMVLNLLLKSGKRDELRQFADEPDYKPDSTAFEIETQQAGQQFEKEMGITIQNKRPDGRDAPSTLIEVVVAILTPEAFKQAEEIKEVAKPLPTPFDTKPTPPGTIK